MLENFEEKPVSDTNNAMHAFSGTPRALPVITLEGMRAVLPGPDGLLSPWPRRTCHEQRDAILFVSETPMDLNARAPMKRDAVWLHGIRDNSYYGSHGSGLGNVCRFSKARAPLGMRHGYMGFCDNSNQGALVPAWDNVCRHPKARAIWGGVRQGCLDL